MYAYLCNEQGWKGTQLLADNDGQNRNDYGGGRVHI